MGVSQKEWNRKARAAGRKAAVQARKQKASTEQATYAYIKAYNKIRDKSPIAELVRKRWNKTPVAKLAKNRRRQRWRKSPAGMRMHRAEDSRKYLRKALQMRGPLLNGWPDAGRIEQKIGSDPIRAEQWRRAAHAVTKGIIFSLLFAATHEDAAYTKKYKIISFEEYAKQLGMLKEWNKLVRR